MSAETYIDTHMVWLNATTRVSSRYVPCVLTGRVKYLDYGKPHEVELMVEVTFESVRSLPKKHWWNKQEMEGYTKTEWVKDADIYIKILPEETIYECTTTSTPSGDSCCENHW